MFIVWGALASPFQKIRHGLLSGHELPTLVHQTLSFGIPQANPAPMTDTEKGLILLLEVLNQRKSPSQASLSPLPSHVNSLLDTVLKNAAGSHILLQRFPSLFLQVSDLLGTTLINCLEWRVRPANRADPNMTGTMQINLTDHMFHSSSSLQITAVPV